MNLDNIKKDKKDKKDKKEKKDKKDIKEEIENLWYRKYLQKCKPTLNNIIGSYYWILHIFIMFSGGLIILFDNNIFHLFILLLITSLDGLACIIFHDCPITTLESKYLNRSILETRNSFLKNGNILYKCEHKYEQTLEFLINMVAFLFGKINVLMLMKLFSIKVNNME
jgi:hypothetical protein